MEYSLHELESAADWVLSKGNKMIAFKGDLGAGKTTLIKAICKKLGVEGSLSSPSFSLVNEYESTGGTVFHFDFYRLEVPEEALDFGVEEYFASNAYCLMEWPEKIGPYLPEETLCISISDLGAHMRRLELC